MSDWVDVTVPVREGMPVYPGDPAFSMRRVSDVSAGDHSTLSEVCMGLHTGTHIDAPAHFIPNAPGIASMPLDACLGPARVIDLASRSAITADELRAHEVRPWERVLLKTRNSELWRDGVFHEDFVHLSTEAAEFLASLPVRCVGVDYLSVGGFHGNGTEVHRALLGAGVWIIEGLDLSAVDAGEYELICLPLRFAGGEASPARAVLRRG